MINIPLKPLVCNYYVTLECNSTCEFCPVWQREEYKNLSVAPLESVEQNLKDLKDLGVRYIDFTGGEPLLRKDFPQILKSAKNLGFRTSVTTNCTLYPERALEFKGLVDQLKFSLDAPTAQEHDRIRGIDCYAQVIQSIKLAKDLGEQPFINFTITRDSIKYLPDMVEISERHNIPLWINPVFNYHELQWFESQSLSYIRYYFGRKLTLMNLASLKFIGRGGNKTNRPRCRAVNSVITISPDNFLLLPCFYHPQKKLKIEGNLKELYRSSLKEERKKQGRYNFCQSCLIWDYMIPSFFYKLDRYFFLNLLSLMNYWWKMRKRKVGRRMEPASKPRGSMGG